VNPEVFNRLRSHPAVAGVMAEARSPELKEVRRWGKRG
jgi:DNA polymerase-3 subunit alpha